MTDAKGVFCRAALASAAFFTLPVLAAPRPPDLAFKSHQIDIGGSESAAVADINRDGCSFLKI